MLYDTISPEEVVDAEAALEFMKEATKLASAEELETIGQLLEAKSRLFGDHLAEDRIGTLDEMGLRRLLGAVFTLRRKAGRLIRHNGLPVLRSELRTLLYGGEPLPRRFDRFLAKIGGLDRPLVISLASEALHFTQPRRHWLWTHWIWNPGPGKGALRLVVQDEVDLSGESDGEVYLRVGEATALVSAHGHTAGYTRTGRGLFGTDIFLACVYAVYMYTVFRVKLSQEFNRILPELPDLVERVLGVHRLGDIDGR